MSEERRKPSPIREWKEANPKEFDLPWYQRPSLMEFCQNNGFDLNRASVYSGATTDKASLYQIPHSSENRFLLVKVYKIDYPNTALTQRQVVLQIKAEINSYHTFAQGEVPNIAYPVYAADSLELTTDDPDSADHNGRDACIVMDYYYPGTLATVMEQQAGSPSPIDEVIAMTHQIGSALIKTHRIGEAHRDVKPTNILANENEEEPNDYYLHDLEIATSAISYLNPGSNARELGVIRKARSDRWIHPFEFVSSDLQEIYYLQRRDMYGLAGVVYYMLTSGSHFLFGDEQRLNSETSFNRQVLMQLDYVKKVRDNDYLPDPIPMEKLPDWTDAEEIELRRILRRAILPHDHTPPLREEDERTARELGISIPEGPSWKYDTGYEDIEDLVNDLLDLFRSIRHRLNS